MNPPNTSVKQALGDQHGGPFSARCPPCGPRNQQAQATSFYGDQSSARGRFGGKSANRGGIYRGNRRRKPYLEVIHPPRTHSNPFGFMNVQSDRPIPLADDHPLKEELAEVKRERESRKLYWAGLAQRIPEELENPGSYDYQRWQEEENLADAKVEELAGLIALAERGVPVMREEPEPKVQDRQPSHSQPLSQGLERTGEKRKRVRVKRGKNRQQPNRENREQNFTSVQEYQGGNRMRYRRPNTPRPHTRETVLWTDDVKTEAVAKWMHDIGANLDEKEERSKIPIFISGNGKSISSFSEEYMDSDQSAYLQQDDDGDTIRKGNISDQIPSRSLLVETHSQAAWTREEEAAFEEAETLREAKRRELAMRMDTMMDESSFQSHIATITKMVMTTDPRPLRDEKFVGEEVATVHVAALARMSQITQKTDTTKQSTPRRTPEGSVEPQTACRTQPVSLPSSALQYISHVGDGVAEIKPLSREEEEARKSSELLAALLEELNRSSESPSPERELQPTSGSAPSYPTSTGTPQYFPTLFCEQGIDKDLNKRFQERKTETYKIPTAPKMPLKIVGHILSNACTAPTVKSPSPHSETLMLHAKTSVICEKQRVMAAAVLKRVQARKLQLGICQRADMATEQQMTVPAKVALNTFTTSPSSEVSKALVTSEDSKTAKEKSTKYMQKASDYMDIDEIDLVEVIDMQDVPKSESEDGKAFGSIKNPMEIDSSSCSGDEEEDSHSDEVGGIRLNNSVVQQEDICGTHIERAIPVMPAAPLPLAGRVLYIGNLSFEATEEDLRALLDDYQIEAIIVEEDTAMQRWSPGYAFAVMSSPSEAESAIADSYDFHINQRMVTVRLGSLPEQYVAMYELPRGNVENLGSTSQQIMRSRATTMVPYSTPQVPVGCKESESQAPTSLLTIPSYDMKTAEEVQGMLDNPNFSLTTLTESQRRKHIAFLGDQLAKITKNKIRREEGLELTVAEMKKINRENDLVHYLKELWRWNGV